MAGSFRLRVDHGPRRLETLIGEAIRDLPEEFRTKLENVAIIEQDYPSEELTDQASLQAIRYSVRPGVDNVIRPLVPGIDHH
jgi:predicted Zn-dependent protease with MMP-like domain